MSETEKEPTAVATEAAVSVRGTLYQMFDWMGGAEMPERQVFIKWLYLVGTFDELAALIMKDRPYYELVIDRFHDEPFRTAAPGYAVFGRRRSWHKQTYLVGVFIPEGKELEVSERLSSELGGVILIPLTLDQLADSIPETIFAP